MITLHTILVGGFLLTVGLTSLSAQQTAAAEELAHTRTEFHFTANARQRPQVRRKDDANHASVWTSTESTAGRSRTMGDQVSPASAEAYTCPPVVPKYTPQESSESTAMASRSTLT